MHGDSTRSVHADRSLADLPDLAPPIRPSTTFAIGSERTYRRHSHETTERFEAVIGALESGHTVAYASGMAAAAAALAHVRPGRVSLPQDVYHGVRDLVETRAEEGAFDVVDPDELGSGDLWWIETPSNPFCRITDLAAVAAEARRRSVITVCDATFATPVLMNPLAFGIDLVMHATTKAIAGHSDVMGGVLSVSDAAMAETLRRERSLTGAVPGSLDVWLALRGVRTLPLRMHRSCLTAGLLTEWFSAIGVPTYYPGLATDPGHGIAGRQMRAMGSMFSVDFGDASTADRFIGELGLFTNATSLGGVESLVERRAISDPTIAPGVVRFSTGIEDAEDLLEDLAAAGSTVLT